MAKKMRVDQVLVARGLAESRARAQALVMAGVVFAGETKIAKPGQTASSGACQTRSCALVSILPQLGVGG